MRLGSRSYWALFGTLLAVSFFGTTVLDRLDGSRPQFVETPAPQTQRLTVQELALSVPREDSPRSRAASTSLRGPVRIEADARGNLFVIDDGDGEVIKELSPAGELLREFRGPGVPPMHSVTDLVLGREHVWVADLLGSALHVLERGHDRWKTVPLSEEPYRLEALEQAPRRLIVTRIAAPHLFDFLTDDGQILRSFGSLLWDQSYHSLALDGFIARSGDSVIYTGKYISAIASFSENGDLNYLVAPIVSIKRPAIVQRGRERRLRHGPIPASESIAADETAFLVLQRRPERLKIRSFVHLYRTEGGRYYGSLALPDFGRWTSVAVGGNYFYAASERGVVRWPRTVLAERASNPRISTGLIIVELYGSSPKKGEADANGS